MRFRRGGIRATPRAGQRGTAPTQSRSDPGADGVSTVVLPAGRNAKAGPQGSNDSQPAAPSSGSRIPPANLNDRISRAGRQLVRPFLVKKVWAISGGTALGVLALGVILLLRPVKPGGRPGLARAAGLPDRKRQVQPRLPHRRRRIESRDPPRTTSRVNRRAQRRPTFCRRGRKALWRVSLTRRPRGLPETASARAGLYLPGG